MRKIVTIFLLFLVGYGCRNIDTAPDEKIDKDSVTFVVEFDKTMGDKDGFYLNGYIVPVPFDTVDSLDGKLIEVSGVVTVSKGAEEDMKEHGEEVQARSGPSKHIIKPVIKIVSSKLEEK